jgi:hypothetical protein
LELKICEVFPAEKRNDVKAVHDIGHPDSLRAYDGNALYSISKAQPLAHPAQKTSHAEWIFSSVSFAIPGKGTDAYYP